MGIYLMLDVGVTTSIVQHKNGGDQKFLDTAWTLLIIRSLIVFFLVSVGAVLFADFFEQPQLKELLPIVALGGVIQAFGSTKKMLANRNLVMKKSIVIDMFSALLGTAITILLAFLFNNVWSLVIGTLIATLLGTLASHFMLPGQHNKLLLDRSCVAEIYQLGRWFLVSSLLTFFSGEGNKLIIGKLLDIKMLAFYGLASNLSTMFWIIAGQISSKVLFPAYSEVVRNHPERLSEILNKTRGYILFPGYLFCLLLALFGQEVIDFLYDSRYSESGWMLIILAMGTFPWVIRVSYQSMLTAMGVVKPVTILQAVLMFLQITLMFIGHHFMKDHGVVAAFAIANWLVIIPFCYLYWKAGCWQPRVDIPLLVGALIFVLIRIPTLNIF